MNDQLKPCPFCGGEATLEGDGDDSISYHVGRAWVECLECGASTPPCCQYRVVP